MKTYLYLKSSKIQTRLFAHRLFAPVLGLALLIVGLAFVSDSALAGGTNACDVTTQAAARACNQAAQSDYSIALGNCANLSDPNAQAQCRQSAAATLQAALQLCQQQTALRSQVCDKLGGGPYDPVIDPANFVTKIDNPYFPLPPGTTFVYEGQTADGFERDVFAVTHLTRMILGVPCVEVHDSVYLNGILSEDTRDWFTQDKEGNVWYFGENSTLVTRGLPTDLSGSWTGGIDSAKPGIVMEAHSAVGDFYRQEFSLANAEDLAQVVSLNESVVVPYGSFDHCLKTLESTPLSPGDLENKYYAPGVGNILTVDLATGERSALVAIETN